MRRTYAGVLGSLAFATVVARGLIHAAGMQSTLATAVTSLVVFATIGAVVGELANWIVFDSVRNSLNAAATEEIKPVPQGAV